MWQYAGRLRVKLVKETMEVITGVIGMGGSLMVGTVTIIQEAVVRHPTISLMLMQMGMFLFMRKTAAIRDR